MEPTTGASQGRPRPGRRSGAARHLDVTIGTKPQAAPPRRSALISDFDRMAAAAYIVDQLADWIDRRSAQRSAALPEEAAWEHNTSSGAGIYSEASELFPGPRSAWVR